MKTIIAATIGVSGAIVSLALGYSLFRTENDKRLDAFNVENFLRSQVESGKRTANNLYSRAKNKTVRRPHQRVSPLPVERIQDEDILEVQTA